MHWGSVWSCAWGAANDLFKFLSVKRAGARSVRVRGMLWPKYQNRYLVVHLNGQPITPFLRSNFAQPFETLVTVPPGETKANIYIEDVGDWGSLPDALIPSDLSIQKEAALGDKISFFWNPPSTFSIANKLVSDPRGDSQLSAISITGMKRGANVEIVPDLPTRGKLAYTIHNVGTTRTVRFWYKNALVAQGSRVGNGSVTCSAVNESGIDVTCTVTYTGDVLHGEAFINLVWPDTYQVHYSTGALAFPRAPEMTALDIGLDDFAAVTPSLNPGTYNVSVVPVIDGVEMDPGSITTTSGLVVLDVPEPPVPGTPTGNAAATTVNWAVGESGCTFDVYYSNMDAPINYGDASGPTPLTTALDATSAILAARIDYPGIVRAIVRASKGGVQERHDQEIRIEYDSAGAIVPARPNKASVVGFTVAGLTLTVKGAVMASEFEIAAANLQLFVKEASLGDFDAADFAAPEDEEALPTVVNGVQRVNVSYTVPAKGWYRIALRSESAASVQSYSYPERFVWLSADANTGAVSNLSAKIMRAQQDG